MDIKSLFSEFPEVSAKQWKQKIQFDLKGADYNETLLWETLEGIHIKPFYHAEDLEAIPTFPLPPNHSWQIGQSIYVANEVSANKKALDVLSRGATSLLFVVAKTKISWKSLFKGIALSSTPIYLKFEFLDPIPVTNLMNYVGTEPCGIFLNIDFIGHLAATGNWYHHKDKDYQYWNEILTICQKNRGISVSGIGISLYQNSGATIVQQLAYALAQANEYLNSMAEQGAVEIKANPLMVFNVAIGSNYFFEIAKLKALRWLWRSLVVEYGIDSDCHIVAHPTKRNKTIYDYNVNMLRTTSECMAAVLGGANMVHNIPYDSLYHKDNEFGERISRNQLLLLKEESYFNEALHAAEGTYYIEALTKQLAEKALELFKQIEASGGFLKQLEQGTIQKKIKESAAKEQGKFDTAELVLVGTNAYQNPQDKMKADLELYPFLKREKRKTGIAPILEKRLAETLEQKRLQDEH
ncbi:methylmalonyl-CoA mutase subunit beta [Croceitalea sp. MTPC5]|uniref:methylmalonyl-CoA mutase subunit beta n=1 Tax=Croceitalea sp. MTPC5 TaxID=3056565 RepID=UPI002B3E6EC3|nr:methylmalonyl-CoA mutase subunit beta [Croceitalea sp. MTPC5]